MSLVEFAGYVKTGGFGENDKKWFPAWLKWYEDPQLLDMLTALNRLVEQGLRRGHPFKIEQIRLDFIARMPVLSNEPAFRLVLRLPANWPKL